MKLFVLFLRMLGILLALLACVMIFGVLYEASLKGGFQSVVDMVIDLNIINWVSVVLFALPTFGAFSIASYIEGKYSLEHLSNNG